MSRGPGGATGGISGPDGGWMSGPGAGTISGPGPGGLSGGGVEGGCTGSGAWAAMRAFGCCCTVIPP